MISTPRMLRPHSIIVVNNIGEDEDGNSITETIDLKYVKVDTNFGAKMSIRTKVGIEDDSTIIITIDLQDLPATKNGNDVKYTSPDKYAELIDKDGYFTINENSYITQFNQEFKVNKTISINPFSDEPLILEVYASGK